MLKPEMVKIAISDNFLMSKRNRKLSAVIILLFGIIEEEQYASVNFFVEKLKEFGYQIDLTMIKKIRTCLNQLSDRHLEKMILCDLLEEKRMEVCAQAAGPISHNGNQRTRALFRLNSQGIKSLNKIIKNYCPQQKEGVC